MGGRVAEELVFGEENITSGASSDIQQATRTARAMVTKYGFSDIVGVVFYDGETGEQASYETRSRIDEEVKKLTSDAYERAKVSLILLVLLLHYNDCMTIANPFYILYFAQALLKKHAKEHKLLAETLLEYETLTGDEVRDIVLRGKKPSRPVVNNKGGGFGDQSLVSSKSKKGKEKSKLAGLLGSRKEEGNQ